MKLSPLFITVSMSLATLSLTACNNEQPIQIADAVTTVNYYYQPNYQYKTEKASYSAKDIDGVVYSAKSVPSWVKVDAKTGAIYGKPTKNGTSKIVIEAKKSGKKVLFKGEIVVDDAGLYMKNPNISSFYNKNSNELRNDLEGDLAGEVQFVQSHSVAPNGNYQKNSADETKSRYMPNVVAQRDALLLFIPKNDSPMEVKVDVFVNNMLVKTLKLDPPSNLPAPDVSADTLSYSTKAWSVKLPWKHVTNGLSLKFRSEGKTGTLPADKIDIGGATQMVLNSIRLGMLTQPKKMEYHHTLLNPVKSANDYFSTLPVSRLVFASYADAYFDKVMVASGKIYTTRSDEDGNVYSGDLRGDVAKSQVSTGINQANTGVTSNSMQQMYKRVYKQFTMHHAWGNYMNGVIGHGLSGGNGIGTLYRSDGNEASHEFGHDHGLPHFPGRNLTADGRWSRHHMSSGWGYLPHRNRMRTNFDGLKEDGSYNFLSDAMAGAYVSSPLSKYSHYTGFSARLIQEQLQRFAIPDASFPNGYKKWNTKTGKYENYVSNNPKPKKTGVPVATILGAYNPDTNEAVLYPVLHGNYGNVFDLPKPNLNSTANQCWVNVSNANGQQKQVAVASTRHDARTVNQLHFNLDASFRPTLAKMYCRRSGQVVEMASRSFDGRIPKLPTLAIVGQGQGIEQLKAVEIKEIDDFLQKQGNISKLPTEIAVKVASYDERTLLNSLSPTSRAKLEAILDKKESKKKVVDSVKVLLNHAKAKHLSDAETRTRLQYHLKANKLSTFKLNGSEISGNGFFFDARQGENKIVKLTAQSDVAQAQRTKWVQDSDGRLRLANKPELCLSVKNFKRELIIAKCDSTSDVQAWTNFNNDNSVLKNKSSGKCLDFDRRNKRLIADTCHGGSNQRWSGIVSNNNLLLSSLDSASLKTLSRLF
ncbi:MAG: ricin-type beta-trefoil lectin domain protein [Moraxellaceae bacterium]|nr:ricin-type beta-trefoil lectin domain protein [Moraxellaceae bacterium]